MSYANQETSWIQKQSSIGGALLINGAIIAGLMFTNHMVMPKPPEGETKTFDVKPKEPPLIEPVIIEPIIAKLPPIDAPIPPIPLPPTQDFTPPRPVEQNTGPIVTAGSFSGSGDIEIPKLPTAPIQKIIADPIFIAAARDPKYASRFQPEYPSALLRQELEGKVRLRFLIGADGRVKSVNILSASHPKFADAAEKQALTKWRFIPATRDGIAVEEWQSITVSFTIN